MKTLTAALILITATPPAQAFFCFSFGSGGGSRHRVAYYPPPRWIPLMPASLPASPPVVETRGQLPSIVPLEAGREILEYQGWHFRPLK